MMRRSLLLMVIAILGMLVTLGLQGCLFGGGGDESAEGGEEGAPAEGAEGMPEEGGEMPAEGGEMPEDAGMGGMPGGEMPMEGAPGEMPMDGAADAGMPAAGGGDAGAMVAEGMSAKKDGDYVSARAQFEAAIAADADNADAHYGLAWILAEMAASGQPNLKSAAIAEFETFLELGGSDDQVKKATDALDRLQ